MSRDGWIDVSVPVKTGMVHWPDNPPVVIGRMLDMDRGARCNVSRMSLGAHTGTHMDAPRHFLRRGAGIEAMPVEATVGPCRVIAIRDRESIKADEIRRHRLRRGERVLFRTRNSTRCWKTDRFVRDFVYISAAAATARATAPASWPAATGRRSPGSSRSF